MIAREYVYTTTSICMHSGASVQKRWAAKRDEYKSGESYNWITYCTYVTCATTRLYIEHIVAVHERRGQDRVEQTHGTSCCYTVNAIRRSASRTTQVRYLLTIFTHTINVWSNYNITQCTCTFNQTRHVADQRRVLERWSIDACRWLIQQVLKYLHLFNSSSVICSKCQCVDKIK